jgi:hypothetical protein
MANKRDDTSEHRTVSYADLRHCGRRSALVLCYLDSLISVICDELQWSIYRPGHGELQLKLVY